MTLTLLPILAEPLPAFPVALLCTTPCDAPYLAWTHAPAEICEAHAAYGVYPCSHPGRTHETVKMHEMLAQAVLRGHEAACSRRTRCLACNAYSSLLPGELPCGPAIPDNLHTCSGH